MTPDTKNKLPNHIAIIMDGNKRWAKLNGLESKSGYRQGAEAAREIVCLLYTSPSPRDQRGSRMPSSA